MQIKEKIVAIIQARMNSSRLPGKVLMPIMERPMLWHVAHRIKKGRLINKLVIATTITKKDEAIVRFCKKNNLDFYKGNEENVLDRYYQTAKIFKAETILRITADCPLIDPKVLDGIIKFYIARKDKIDYVSNTLKRTYPHGLDAEIFSFKVLERIWQEAKEPYQKEHVTPYIYEHPEKFCIGNIKNHKNYSYLRWTVDTEKDLKFVREIYKRLYKNNRIFCMQEILNLLKKEPQLLKINKGVRQKQLKQLA